MHITDLITQFNFNSEKCPMSPFEYNHHVHKIKQNQG